MKFHNYLHFLSRFNQIYASWLSVIKHCAGIVVMMLLLITATSHAQYFNQDPGNPNLDFSLGNFNGWNIAWGPRTHPDSIPGAQAGANSHTIVEVYGSNYDGNAGAGNLQRVPVGLEKVARLGAPAGGGYTNPTAYSMSCPIVVHAAYPILHFQMAAIMDRSHALAENTHYRFKIMDANGNYLMSVPCAGLELFPNGSNSNNTTSIPSISNFVLPGTGAVLYQPWQSVAIDLTAFIGQIIRIQFDHFDCISGFHGSYDYLSVAMRPDTDTVYYCPEGNAVIRPYLPHFKSYVWNTGSNADSLLVNNPIDGSIYNCTVSSYNGCSTTFHYRLKAIETNVDFNAVVGSQCNQMQFAASAITTKGNIVAYEWDFDDTPSGIANTATGTNPAHIFTAAGTYMVTLKVTTSEGCRKTITKMVQVATENASATISIKAPTCIDDTITVTDISISGISRSWYLNQNSITDTTREISLVFSEPGTQQITLRVIGSNGCPDSVTEHFVVYPKPLAVIKSVPESAPITDPQFQFYAIPDNASSYSWDLGNGVASNDVNPMMIYDNLIHSYKVTLHITDMNGCIDTATKWVYVMPPDIFIPDAFSPNGDGLNDVFKIVNVTNQQLLECSVFNRHGQRVFYSMDAEIGWDGRFQDKLCDVGNYYYLIRLKTKMSEPIIYKGNILLIR